MHKLLVTLSLVSTLFNVNSQTKNFIDQPYLETTATADTLVQPDIIFLDILIQEKDSKNKISVEELETKMAKTLEALNIDLSKQLALSDLASNFKTYFLKQKDVLKSKAYTLKVFSAQTASKVLVELENIGISNITLDKIEYSEIEALKLKLKSKAVQKAKIQADYLVAPLNQKVGKALFIADTFYQSYDYSEDLEEVVALGFNANEESEYTPIEIEFKPIKIKTTVSVKFSIE